jgi:hypothetical protein
MSANGWEQLAAQAPIVLIFAGALLFIMRDQAKNNREMLSAFMQYMKDARDASDRSLEKRDAAINTSLVRIADCLDKHDDFAKEHDTFVRQQWKDFSK